MTVHTQSLGLRSHGKHWRKMNCIVYKLAVESGLISSESNGFDRVNMTPAEKRFAALIVHECAKHVRNSSCFTFRNQAEDEAAGLAQHFGII